jgi:hypothetical protein
MAVITYKPPPILRAFIKDHKVGELFFDWVVGPVGSGKTTSIFMKLIRMAKLQARSPDGIRRTRAVIVRNTMPQLKDTTLVSWGYWFKDGQAGHWNATDKIFTLKFDDCECQVLFRPLDTPDDVNRVLSLELNFAVLDEFVEIPKAIIDALSARLGRYKQPDGTPVTVWGMWGSSNPSTEDNWWFDYLHGGDVMHYHVGMNHQQMEDIHRARMMILDKTSAMDLNTIYFHQPSGMSPEAENLENLPPYKAHDHSYYINLMKGGRSKAWGKQFVDAEWGYSSAGQAVTPYFDTEKHIAKSPLIFNPGLMLVIGMDPGLGGSALIFMQEDLAGRINVLGELVQRGYGTVRMVKERLVPYLRNRFPLASMDRIIIALDPAGANRAQTDEKASKKMLEDFGFMVDCETNNRFPLRLAAYEHYLNGSAEGLPAFVVDPIAAPTFVRALKGGWRYASDAKKDILKGNEPDKQSEYSHPGDAGGYGLRYFHRGLLRFEKYGVKGKLKLPGQSQITVRTPRYHFS